MKLIFLINSSNVALVDDVDHDFLSKFSWYQNENGYADCTKQFKGKTHHKKMHRVITLAPEGIMVDHANRDRLDNRSQNLRFCIREENNHNSQKPRQSNKLRGAHWSAKDKRFYSRISKDKKVIRLGSYKTAEEAHEAYKIGSLKHYGIFSPYYNGENIGSDQP